MRSLRVLRAAFWRRIVATRLVWRRGGAHMAMLVDPEPAVQEPAQPAHPLPAGGFDLTAAGDAPVPRSVISVTGWAVTPTGACSRIELTVNGHRVGRARLGEMRRDAQLYLGQQAAALSG